MRQGTNLKRFAFLGCVLLAACSHGADNETLSESARVQTGLVALYELDEGAGTQILDTSGVGTPLNLTIQTAGATTWTDGALRVTAPAVIRSAERATKLINAFNAANAVSVEAWVKPQSASQPEARIVSNAPSIWARNLTLGHGLTAGTPGNAYEARLRSTATNHQGIPGLLTPGGAATTSLQHVVYTRAASGAARIYVDGVERATGTTGGTLNFDPTFPLALASELDGTRPWLGELHMVALYAKALSPSEVAQNFAAGPNGDGNGGEEPPPPDGAAPIARLLVDVASGPAPLAIQFDGRDSETPEGSITSYEWFFGDGDSATGAQVSHTFVTPGEYVTRLRVRNTAGVASDAVIQVRATGQGSGSRVTTGLSVLYPLDETSGSVVRDLSGVGTPLDLTIQTPSATSWQSGALRITAPTVIRSAGRATKVISAVTAAGAVSAEAWVTPAVASQPEARILTVSNTYHARNLSLGQGLTSGSSGSAYEARLRTSGTNHQGMPGLLTPSGVAQPSLQHVLFARETNGTTRLYVNGTERATGTASGSLNWDPGFSLGLANEVDGVRPWLGDLHLAAVYARALSQSEVQQNFAAGPSGSVEPSSAPTPVASASPVSGTAPLRVVFEGGDSIAAPGSTLSSFAWTFGDGASSSGASAEHVYGAAGSFAAQLVVTDSQGRTAQVTVPIQVAGGTNLPPIASFTRSPASGTAPLAVSFNAGASNDPDGSITSYTWTFGDGSTGSGVTTSHTYTAPGSYVVELAVQDTAGAVGTTTQSVQVTSSPPPPTTGSGDVPFEYFLVDANPPQQTHVKAMGDIDGDGYGDLVIAGAGNGDGGLFWYDGKTFTRYEIRPMTTVTGYTTDGQLADVDGDGDLDIVVPKGEAYGSDVFWYENPRPSGDPRTTLWPEHTIGSAGTNQAHDVEVADLDGDGKVDVVVRKGPTTAFFQNSADDWTRVVLSTTPSEGLALGDVDRDGDVDVVINGRWLENPGTTARTATWTAWTFSSDAPNDSSVTIADLNGDGRPDLVQTASEGTQSLRWFAAPTNPKGGTWTARVIAASATFQHTLTSGDVDLDGDIDIVTAEMHQSPNPDEVVLWRNDGQGTSFTKQVIDTKGSHNAVLADIDGDGDLDLYGANWNGLTGVDLWINRLDPTPEMAKPWVRRVIDASRTERAVFITDGDIDGDGRKDVIAGRAWYKNPGSLGGTWQKRDFGGGLTQMASVYDFDGDGDLDVLGTRGIGDAANRSFLWGRNDGSGTFTVLDNVQSPATGDFLQGCTVARLTPGGPLQVVFAWHNLTGGTSAFSVPSDPSSGTWALSQLASVTGGEGVDAGDVDRDGDLDVLIDNRYLRNDRTSFTAVQAFPLSGAGQPDRNLWVDMDGDGDLDILIGYENDPTGRVAWYEQPTGAGPWAQHIIANVVNPHAVEARDMDGDGDLDVVVGEHRTTNHAQLRLLVFEHLGGTGRIWRRHVVYTGDEHHDGAHIADIDGDGDYDIVSMGWYNNLVTLYESTFSD